jgi:transposase
MKELPDLKQLTDEAKDALILALGTELQKLQQKRPQKTSKNSSLPPAKGFKAEVKQEEPGSEQQRAGSIGREGGGRPLSEHPDQIIEASVKTCQTCGTEIAQTDQQLMERDDKIELPPIAPIVTRVERYGGDCPECGARQIAAVPVGMEPGSPYGHRIAALVTTMRYSHGISYGRMEPMLDEVFGLAISQGAIANLLSRVKAQLQSEVDGILGVLRSSRLVGSDETSARVNGKNQWEWVFQNDQVCFHLIRPSRGGDGISEVMADHRPQVWVSDLFSAQKTHPAASWQVWLAHQLRDCQSGIDAGDEIFSGRMKRLLLRALVLQKRWLDLAPSTRYQYRCR